MNNTEHSLWSSFNELLAKLLWTCYDASSNKIYKNVIDAIVNGALNKQVFDNDSSLEDTNNGNLANGDNTEYENKRSATTPVGRPIPQPTANKFLLRSLATILRTAYTVRGKNQPKPYFLLDSIAEVANYMKESYRVNLPVYRNLFKELINRAEFYRQMLACNCFDVANKDAMDDFCDAIVRASMDVVKACDLVLRETGDDPKFMEVYQGSIADYKSQNGKLPFMPLSTTMRALAPNNTLQDNEFLPFNSFGESELNWHMECVVFLGNMGKNVMLEQAPGFAEVVDMYNITTDARFAVDKKKAEDYLNLAMKALKYLTETRHYKGYLSSAWSLAGGAFLDNALPNYIPLVGANVNITGVPPVAGAVGNQAISQISNWSLRALNNVAGNISSTNVVVPLMNNDVTNLLNMLNHQ